MKKVTAATAALQSFSGRFFTNKPRLASTSRHLSPAAGRSVRFALKADRLKSDGCHKGPAGRLPGARRPAGSVQA